MKVNPQKLFSYADNYARKYEKKGKVTQYPTLRQCTKRFKVSLDDIEDAVDLYDGEGYLGIAVALGISGVGSSEFEHRGEYLLEAYK